MKLLIPLTQQREGAKASNPVCATNFQLSNSAAKLSFVGASLGARFERDSATSWAHLWAQLGCPSNARAREVVSRLGHSPAAAGDRRAALVSRD